jgi:hypothetical protein
MGSDFRPLSLQEDAPGMRNLGADAAIAARPAL